VTARPDGRPRDPLLHEEGRVALLLGNEAIVRGALEAGVAFACGYPGTPSSEITDSFARIAAEGGIAFEYSVNEKVALEMTFAASLAGARGICAMKHLGLMYAGDPLTTIPYVGAVGGMVIVSAGDPGCLTSPNEQDQRYLAPMLHIPMLDPGTPQEALEMTRFAFDLSEKARLPVILRPTTRVCHSRAPVRCGPLSRPSIAGFRRDPRRFVPVPANARALRVGLKERIETARGLMAEAGFFRREGRARTGILASGAPAVACADLLRENGLGDRVSLLSLGVVHPLPTARLVEALAGLDRVLVVEELSPYLEDALGALCSRHRLATEILGKRTGHLPEEFEYTPDVIARGIRQALGLDVPVGTARAFEQVPPRPPVLCSSCPHRATFHAARAAFGPGPLFFNDIGCYSLGYGAPLESADALLCMGAGFTLAAGASRMTGERTVGFVGDSTFFHSGMPALLNAVKEDANMVAVILDNKVTAMTGFQESPGVKVRGGRPEREIPIEAVVRALGATRVEVVDPNDQARAIEAFRRARDAVGLSVVIAVSPCPVFLRKVEGEGPPPRVYAVDHTLCRACGREACGTRCDQPLSVPFVREMARARASEVGGRGRPLPAVAPCAEQCPLNLCIQGYATHIAAGDYRAALDLITSRLCLPDTVCRVCNRPCESVCVRGGIDGPVAINDLKRFVVDRAAEEGAPPYRPPREPPHGRKVAVVGAGPAGLAAAHDLFLRGYEVAVFDAEEGPGGMLRHGIPEHRLPREALERDIRRIFDLGISFRGGAALGRDVTLGGLLGEGYDAVFLGLGARRGLRPDMEVGAGSPPIVDALQYLRAAPSGGAVPGGGTVVVIGGGNAAVDSARTARRRGAERVRVLCPEGREEMAAIAEEVLEAEREGIEIRPGWIPVRAGPGGVEFARARPGGPPFLAVEGPGTLVEAGLVILAVGQEADRGFLGEGDPALEWTPDGRLRVDPDTGRTSHPRVFAGGDLAPGERMVTSAMASGIRAAWGIDRALRGPEAADRRMPPPRVTPPGPPAREGVGRVDGAPRRSPPRLPAEEAVAAGPAEVVGVLTEEQARSEAARCMVCGLCANCSACIDSFGCPAFYRKDGLIHIDPKLCTGCGVCAQLCPNGAIRPRGEA
jgi:indolepyruvate ferredoxin oxidoreductase alpha subunit